MDDEEAVATAVPVTTADALDDGMSDSSSAPKYADDSAGSSSSGGADKNNDMLANEETAFAALAFASLMILIQSSHDCDQDGVDCEDERAYAVFQGVLQLVVIGLHFLFFFVPALKNVTFWHQMVEPFLTIFLFVWAVIGVFVLTFKHHDDNSVNAAPFRQLGTGWLAMWSSLGILTVLLYPELAPFWNSLKEKCGFLQNVGATGGHGFIFVVALFLSSMIVFIEAADICDKRSETDGEDCDGKYAWALTCSLVGWVYALVLLVFGKCLDSRMAMISKFGSVSLAIWWFFGIAVMCVDGPFHNAGTANGFVGSYAAFGFSCFIALQAWGIVEGGPDLSAPSA